MAERKKSKESKGNEGEEGTDGSKQKGGGGEKDYQQKRSRLGGAAYYVHKRVTGQPKSTPKKKEVKSDLSSFDTPAPPPSLAQESSQQQLGSIWNPAPWPQDTKQPAPVAVVSSVPSGETLPSTEGATPPTAMKYDDDDDDLTSLVLEAVVPHDDVELSLKLARIEMDNCRYKKELKDKERQIKEYEEEIIILRTQKSRSGGRGGVQVGVDQSTTQKLTRTIQQLEREKEELMMELEVKHAKEEELMRENSALKKEFGELVKDEDRITNLTQLLEKEKEERRKGEEHVTELEEKHAIELEGVIKQLDTLRAEKNKLEMNYQEQEKEYEAQIKELEEEMDKKLKQLEETAAKIKQKETTAKVLQEKEAVLKEVEDLRNEVKMRTQDIETLEAQVAEAGGAYKKLEAQLKEQEDEIETRVNERLREEVDKHLREAVKASQKIDEQKKFFADHVKEKEHKVKTRYEVLLASKERRIKELGTELEEIMEQLKQKEETERNLREEITNLELKLEGIMKQLDILRVEKNQLEMNYQEQEKEYEAQIKELEKGMDEKLKQVQEETAAEIKQQKEATAQAQDRKKEAVLKEVEDLRNEVKMRKEDVETLEARVAEAGDAYKKLEAQLKEQEEEIEARVNERLREEVDKHLREAVKAQLTSQKIDEQKKVFADHVKEKEDKVKARYEILLVSKERRIKELGTELEEIMEQLKQKEEVEHNLREEITNLQLKVDDDSANNSLSEGDKLKRELEDQVVRVRDLEEMISKVEKNKREDVAVLEIHMKDKDEEIQKLKGQVQNDVLLSMELRKQLADAKKNIEELEDYLSNKAVEIEELSDALIEKEEEIIRLRRADNKATEIAAEEKKQTAKQLKGQVDELLRKNKTQERQMKDLVEKIQLKETENELFKLDFESERNDRERINDQLIKLQTQYELLKQEAAEKEKEAQMKLHNLKQSNSTLVYDLEKSGKEISFQGAEIESLVKKNAQLEKQHTEEMKKIKKKLRESEQGEMDRIKEMDADIQVLTAQVNAYSREVDRQKRLVTQSKEKHKIEVIELNERLINELKSKQQLDKELDRMRQQLANVSADKEQLLKAYKEQTMVTVLEDKIRNMQQASVTLRERMSKLQKQLSGFQNSWKLSHREVFLTRQELGRGGWGVVWVGQLRVAVKQLHEWIVSQHNMETFHHEISIMSQLRHPNLVQFIGVVLDHPSGYPMIVTEVMDTSLREAYERRELTPDPGCRPVILSIMHDAAEGLNYLHCLLDPIIHRDVSSANVLLQSIGYRKWKGKISDFGSAKLAKKAITKAPGAFVYSAPEALQSIASQDPTKKQTTKMDVFSYGILLSEIITCHFPDDIAMFQGMLRQVQSISNRPSGTRDTQGSLLHSLIVSCCHDDPSRRPTMKEIIEQLDIISK